MYQETVCKGEVRLGAKFAELNVEALSIQNILRVLA